MIRQFICLCVLSFSVSAHSDEAAKPLVIVGAGNGAERLFAGSKAEAEKFAGAPFEYRKYRAALAAANLARGTIDVFTGPRIDSFFPVIEKEFSVPKQKLEDYRFVPTRTSSLFVFHHPKNPIEKLTPEQIGEILSGKITTWKPINGKPDKLEAYVSRDKTFITLALQEKFLNGAPLKISQTIDDDGLMRIVSQNPNAIAFTSEPDKPAPGVAQLPAHVTYSHYITIKKDSRSQAHKLLDWVQDNIKVKPN